MAATLTEGEPFVIGKWLTIQSAVLGEERQLVVFLPRSYETDSDKRYPTLYALDGVRPCTNCCCC